MALEHGISTPVRSRRPWGLLRATILEPLQEPWHLRCRLVTQTILSTLAFWEERQSQVQHSGSYHGFPAPPGPRPLGSVPGETSLPSWPRHPQAKAVACSGTCLPSSVTLASSQLSMDDTKGKGQAGPLQVPLWGKQTHRYPSETWFPQRAQQTLLVVPGQEKGRSSLPHTCAKSEGKPRGWAPLAAGDTEAWGAGKLGRGGGVTTASGKAGDTRQGWALETLAPAQGQLWLWGQRARPW